VDPLRLTVFSGLACTDVSEFHEAAETVLARPVYTHEFAEEDLWLELQARWLALEAYLELARRTPAHSFIGRSVDELGGKGDVDAAQLVARHGDVEELSQPTSKRRQPA
jgi:hypothetical protein